MKTAEPKMPEVIMVEPFSLNAAHLEDFNSEVKRNRDLSKWKAYHHDDKVQELKLLLVDFVRIGKCIPEFNSIMDNLPKQFYNELQRKITKASNLLK